MYCERSGCQGEGRYRVRPTTQSAQIHISQAPVIAQPMLRQVSHTTPMGVSQLGHQSSGRRRCRSTTVTAGKPTLKRVDDSAHSAARAGSPSRGPRPGSRPCWWRPSRGGRSRPPRTCRCAGRGRSRCRAAARVSSFALGEAFTISKPSSPASTSESSRPQWLRSYSGMRGDGERTVERYRRRPGAGSSPAQSRRYGPRTESSCATEQHDVRPPGAHLAAAAERERRVGRHQAGGRVVIGDEDGVEPGPLMPARDSSRCRSRPIAVPRTSCDALVWLWKSTTATPGSAPASLTIGRWERRPPRDERRQPPPARPPAPCSSSRRLNRRRRIRRTTRQATKSSARPTRKPWSRLMLSIATPSQRV